MNDEKLKRAIELQKEIKELKFHYTTVRDGGAGKSNPLLEDDPDKEHLYEIGKGNQKPSMEITTAFSNTKIPLIVELLPIPVSILVKIYLSQIQNRIDRLQEIYENL